jgi:hypothetical protein
LTATAILCKKEADGPLLYSIGADGEWENPVWNRDSYNLLPVAIANCLGIIVILLSSDPKLPFQSIIPHADVHFTKPIYLAYTAFGSGHYDGICEKSFLEESSMSSNGEKQEKHKSDSLLKGCRCGINAKHSSKEQTKMFCTKKSRCPCTKANQSCSKCQCFNCDNDNSKEMNICSFVPKSSPSSSKKRDHSGKLIRTTAENFMINENAALKGKRWTLKEELLLMEILDKDKKNRKLDVILKEFNDTVAANGELGSIKTKLGLSKKLSAIKKT